MLAELRVCNLGVIEEFTLVFGPGMTALTGETGAGKTLVVEAIELLVGGRPDAVLVRPGASEAVVEGRFVGDDGDEVILTRIVPADGRSRAYVGGRMATVAALSEQGGALVDLHGQHAHQSLLSAVVQRDALDRFGRLEPLVAALADAKDQLRSVQVALADLGGDAQARAREIDLLRFQLAELRAAGVDDAGEDAALEAEEDVLADAAAHREAAAAAYEILQSDDGALDALGAALAQVAHRSPMAAVGERLRGAQAEVTDLAAELRTLAETMADDPARLAEVRARRQLLRDLQRKYGPTLVDVMAFAVTVEERLGELESHDERATALEEARIEADADVRARATKLGQARRRAAPALAKAVEGHLQALALPRARFAVDVGETGDQVEFGLGANPGEPVLPLTKVASGGELARTMLAARLVLSEGPPTLVFDEVDAGVGGGAASAVGHALAALGHRRQVLVVTHLAQVAAFARDQIAVTKAFDEASGRTVVRAAPVSGEQRIIELSRMLAGRPDSASARQHAAELLATATAQSAAG